MWLAAAYTRLFHAVAGYLRRHGYDVTIADAIGEGLNRYWELEGHPGYICQGLPFGELIDDSRRASSSPAVEGRRAGSRSIACWRTAANGAGRSGATSRTLGGGSSHIASLSRIAVRAAWVGTT